MSPIDVKEDYKKRRLRITPNGWEAERGWTVAYAPNEMVAIQQAGIPIQNEAHNLSPLLFCQWVGLEEYNFNLSRVRALYGRSQVPNTADPLLQRPVMRFSRGQKGILVDRDFFARPIVNSCGDPITGVNRNFPVRQFTITRNEPYWDPRLDARFADTYNSTNFAPLGFPVMEPGQCRCLSIMPGADIQPPQEYVPVVYSFEYGAGEHKGSDGVWDTFRFVKLDSGRTGWYDAGGATPTLKRGRFVDGNGAAVEFDVRLDGGGVPIDPTIKIADPRVPYSTLFSPVPPPDSANRPGMIVELTRPDAFLLVYEMLQPADYSVFRF